MTTNAPSTARARRLRERRARGVAMVAPVEVGQGGVALLVSNGLLKEAILEAAENAGGKAGMIGYLTEQAEKSPGPFMALLGKVLPLQVANAEGESLTATDLVNRDGS